MCPFQLQSSQNISSVVGLVGHIVVLGFPDGSVGEESACNAGVTGDMSSIPGLGRRKWQVTSIFLPEKSHGHRSLAG